VDDLLMELKHRAKQCLAAVLFITLLIGASAAALALLAAGISTLSSPRTLSIAYPSGQYPTAVQPGTTSGLTNRPQSAGEYTNQTQAPSNTGEPYTSDLGSGGGGTADSNAGSPQITTPNTQITTPNTNVAGDSNGNVERTHSIIGEALNNGGVVLGNHIQQLFGNIVAGIMQTLFLEQNDNSSTQTQGLSTNQSTTQSTNQSNGGGGQ
jgi:hypothetical protein